MRRWGHRGAGEEGWLGPETDHSLLPPDLRLINTQAIFAKRSGMIILGGGVVKHHIANANLMVSGDTACAWSPVGAALGPACRRACVLGPCQVSTGRQPWTRPARIPALLGLRFHSGRQTVNK